MMERVPKEHHLKRAAGGGNAALIPLGKNTSELAEERRENIGY